MSQMEEDASRFLKRIVWTISSVLIWMIINLGLGIFNGWMIPEHGVAITNILFYVWLLISLVILIWFNYKIWKEKFPHG